MHDRKNATGATIETYRHICVAFVRDVGAESTYDLTILKVDQYANYLAKKYPCAKTLRNKLTIIRAFIRWMYARDLVSFKPELIELPKEEATEANFMTPEEAARFLGCITNVRDKAMMHFILATGVRVNELIEMRLQDIYERSVVVRNGKGRKPRVTFITKDCEADLKKYLRKRGRHDGVLFPNPAGNKLSRALVAKKVRHYAKKARIEKKVTTHTLRHTFATGILRNGARVEDVQQLLGHANIRATSIYLHFTDAYLAERYDKFM